jgi:hypothetical protein
LKNGQWHKKRVHQIYNPSFLPDGSVLKDKTMNIRKVVGFVVSMVVAMKRVIFWDVLPCRSCEN